MLESEKTKFDVLSDAEIDYLVAKNIFRKRLLKNNSPHAYTRDLNLAFEAMQKVINADPWDDQWRFELRYEYYGELTKGMVQFRKIIGKKYEDIRMNGDNFPRMICLGALRVNSIQTSLKKRIGGLNDHR